MEQELSRDKFCRMQQDLAKAGGKIRKMQEGMKVTDEAHSKQVGALHDQLEVAGTANSAMRTAMAAADEQVLALQAQLAEAKLGGEALQTDLDVATASESQQVQALRQQLQTDQAVAEEEAGQLRHAGAVHARQVVALQTQLADVGEASKDMQASIAAADAARNLQVAAMQRQLTEAGDASKRLQAGISAADEARNRQMRELQRQLAEAGVSDSHLQASAPAAQLEDRQWRSASGSRQVSEQVGQPSAELNLKAFSGPRSLATSEEATAAQPGHGSASGESFGTRSELLEGLLTRMADDPQASLIDGQRITWCTNPDGSRVLLGEGAFSQVYRVLLDGVQPHAAKVLQLGNGAEAEELFVREAALLKQLRHRNIVGFSGVCVTEDDRSGVILMELMEGRSLHSRLHQRSKSGERLFGWWARGRAVALDVARALHYLHSANLTHFDLKSSNVLLTRELVAKLADVGFTKPLQGSCHSMTEGRLGTFNYMAPELLMGSPCTSCVDIWSFGVLLFELCSGEDPTRGSCRTLRVPEEVPQEVADLYQECLEQEPTRRPTATQLVQRLSRLQQPGSVS